MFMLYAVLGVLGGPAPGGPQTFARVPAERACYAGSHNRDFIGTSPPAFEAGRVPLSDREPKERP